MYVNKKLTTQEFITRAKLIHGDKYDYTKSVYTFSKDKVVITCPTHGDWQQVASAHLFGKGCKKCGLEHTGNIKRGLAKQDFIDKAKKVHGNKYDYTNTIYTSARTKLTINCPVHGDFDQNSQTHLQGAGCMRCGKLSRSEILASTSRSTFEERSREVHGNRYDYSQVVYVNTKSRVKIFCRLHGYFEQNPHDHLLGCGCQQCSYESRALTLEEFTEKAHKVHNNFYSYGKFTYKNAFTKSLITCPIHGDFKQAPSNHLQGSGCSACARLRISDFQLNSPVGWSISNWQKCASASKNFDGFKVYILKLSNDNEQFYKIGRTYRKTIRRINGIPYQGVVVYEIRDENPETIYKLENKLKQQYKSYRYTPKVEFAGMCECFNIDLPLQQIIEQYPTQTESENSVSNLELSTKIG
jgi:hypothetical protein